MDVRIAILGDHDRGYLTHREIDAVVPLLPPPLQTCWVASDAAEAAALDGYAGIWVAPGTPYRDAEAVLRALGRARRAGTPLLATCGGCQSLLLEFARSEAGLPAAAHAETEPQAEDPLIAPLACSLVGETRSIVPVPGTLLARVCGSEPFDGFHFCSFGLSAAHEQRLVEAGLRISARATDAGVEGVELPGHPFYVGTLFQPQVGNAAAGRLHPLLAAFGEAVLVAAGTPVA